MHVLLTQAAQESTSFESWKVIVPAIVTIVATIVNRLIAERAPHYSAQYDLVSKIVCDLRSAAEPRTQKHESQLVHAVAVRDSFRELALERLSRREANRKGRAIFLGVGVFVLYVGMVWNLLATGSAFTAVSVVFSVLVGFAGVFAAAMEWLEASRSPVLVTRKKFLRDLNTRRRGGSKE